jgi:hypothetical protein
MFPSTSSNEELTTADWPWAEGGVSLRAEASIPKKGIIIKSMQARQADMRKRISFMVFSFPPGYRDASISLYLSYHPKSTIACRSKPIHLCDELLGNGKATAADS